MSIIRYAIILLCISLLPGCQRVEKIEANEQSTAVAVTATTSQMEGNVEGTEVPEVDSAFSTENAPLTVDSAMGVCQYILDSWEIYDSWTTAGIDQAKLSNGDTSDLGVVIVTLTACCQERHDFFTNNFFNLNNVVLLTRTQVDNASPREDRLWITGDEPCYFDKTGLTDDSTPAAYFHYPVLSEGESVTYKIGFALSKTTSEAAENQSLLLSFSNGSAPASVEDLLLIPLT